MRKTVFLLSLAALAMAGARSSAQTYAQLKVWDSHQRYPMINEIEFVGADSALATYDAIYGHGAMMENESYALRVYVDARQSVDLYGKKSSEPELSVTNFYSTPDLVSQGYGEDILFVGGSIGAGSFRGYHEGVPTLVEPVLARGQRVLWQGGDSAAIELWDRDWQYPDGQTLQLRQRFTMRKGSRATQVDVWLEGCSDATVFATGVQKLERDNEGLALPGAGVVASWGTNEPEKGEKPGVMETLGIAVVVPPEYLHSLVEDELNYLCLVHPVGGHIRYYLLVAPDMQRIDGIHSAADWFAWLRAEYGE